MRLSKQEKLNRIQIVSKYTGVVYKYPNKLNKKKIKSIYAQFRKIKYLLDNDYEFVPATTKSKKGINLEKRIVRKFYPQKLPAKTKGFFIPKSVAGPEPSVNFDFERRSFEVISPVTSNQKFIPSDEDVMFTGDEETDEDIIDRLLSEFGDNEIIVPISNRGDLSKVAAGNKRYVKQIILDWINAYGYSTAPTEGKNKGSDKHLMKDWFEGFKVIES